MKKKTLSKKMYWIIGGSVAVIAIVLYIVLSSMSARKASTANLQTVRLEKGDLTAIVGATGSVRANQSATLTWQTSGRVQGIEAEIGDQVSADQVLASLLEPSLPQSVILAKAELVNAERNLDNLVNSNLAEAQARLNLVNAQEAYDQVRWNSLTANDPRSTNQDRIDAARSAVTLAEDKVEKAQEAYDRFAERQDSDPLKAAALSNLANTRINLDIAKKNLNYYISSPDSKEVAISDAKVAVALAQLEDAQREWERQQNGPDPKDIEAAESRVAAIQATIDMSIISTPFDGTITDMSVMVGDLVSPGKFAFRVDDLSHMLVDVQIPEVDINRIKTGQPVEITFDAITATAYEGRVVDVARVGSVFNGIVNFNVTIEILNPDEQVLPGMTAAVNMIVNQLTDVLTVPNRAVRFVDGKRVVYVLKNNTPTPVQIEIGASSDSVSEITAGDLKIGDIIILNPPTDFTNFGSPGGMPF